MNQIEIYQTKDKETQIEVQFEGESVWLTQKQMASLLGQTKQNVSLHIKNCFREKELNKNSTVKESLTVQKEGNRVISRKVELYNLDVIISVGYRVKSKQGVQFRQWATQRLKDHLIKGYTFNEARLKQLNQTIELIKKGGETESLSSSEAKGLLEIISTYTQSFVILNRFDNNTLATEKLDENITYEIKYDEASFAIGELKKQLVKKKEAGNLFGQEKDSSFEGILGSIVQTFDGEYLYKSIEEQAAHLLYFTIKNHPFNDGNKRIGAFLFIWFLEKNKHQFKKSGEVKINDNALVALALLIAQSHPSEKELMIKLVINLIKG